MRNKAKLQRQQALERAQEAKRSPLSDKTNLALAKSNIHDLKERINSLDTELSETQTALTRSDKLLKRICKQLKHHLIWNNNARKAMKRSKSIILGLQGKNRTQLSVNEGLRNDMDEFKNKLTEKEGELSSCQLQANSYLQAVASANLRALGYWNELQLAYEIKRTPSFTISGDRTTHKNQTFESMHANFKTKKSYLNEDGTSCTSEEQVQCIRFIKLKRAGNHRAETQKNETITCLCEAVDIFNKSPLASADNIPGRPFNKQVIAMKCVGTHGDHAEDQKAKHRLLGEWKHELTMRGLGVQYLCSKSDEEREMLIASARASHISQTGSLDACEMLSEDERIQKDAEIFEMLCKSLSDEAFKQLSETEKRRLNMWVWARCGMHKDLNAVKGGDSAMQEKWKEIKDSPGPVLLVNRDNAAVLEPGADNNDDEYEDIGDSATHVLPSFEYKGRGAKRGSNRKEMAVQKRVRKVSKAGGKKLMDLMGDMLKNRNDKKGHQHTFRDFALFTLDCIINFPGTSNTRYLSYLEAL
ncbi:hypothetical protein ACEPAI_6977 [Sanghuangporus weigelae]